MKPLSARLIHPISASSNALRRFRPKRGAPGGNRSDPGLTAPPSSTAPARSRLDSKGTTGACGGGARPVRNCSGVGGQLGRIPDPERFQGVRDPAVDLRQLPTSPVRSPRLPRPNPPELIPSAPPGVPAASIRHFPGRQRGRRHGDLSLDSPRGAPEAADGSAARSSASATPAPARISRARRPEPGPRRRAYPRLLGRSELAPTRGPQRSNGAEQLRI